MGMRNTKYLLTFTALCICMAVLCWLFSTMELGDFKPRSVKWQRDSVHSEYRDTQRRHTETKEKVITVGCRGKPNSTSVCETFKYSTHQQHSKGYNHALLGYGKCIQDHCTSSVNNETEKIIWITNFIDYRLSKYAGKMGWNLEGVQFADKQNMSEALEARMSEIIATLKSNLKHPMIEEIHVMVQDWESVFYLRSLVLTNSSRLVLQFLNGGVTMKAQLLYAVRCFEDRIVAIGHQDNMVGAGWDQLQPDILRRNKTFFPITRNPSITGCAYSSGFSCKQGAGSHDTFLFHAKKDITEDKLKRMETVTPNARGMEHVLIWIFLKDLGYGVVNPCLTLIVHHEHCVPLRENKRKRFYPWLPNFNFYHEWKTPIVNLTVFQNDQLNRK